MRDSSVQHVPEAGFGVGIQVDGSRHARAAVRVDFEVRGPRRCRCNLSTVESELHATSWTGPADVHNGRRDVPLLLIGQGYFADGGDIDVAVRGDEATESARADEPDTNEIRCDLV